MPEVRRCGRCKNEVMNPDAAFCGYCGYDLSRPSVEESRPAQTPNYIGQPSKYSYAGSPGATTSSRTGYDPSMDYLNSANPYASGITNIIPVTQEPLFKSGELPYILGHILAAFISYLMRYMLLLDSFPLLEDLATSLVLYALFILVLFYMQISEFRKNGVEPEINVDKFDISSSMVLSSFFVSTISHQFEVVEERSTLPEEISYIVDVTKPAVTMKRRAYIEEQVRPKVIKRRYFYTLIAGYLVWLLMSSSIIPALPATKLFIQYVGVYSFMEVAPSVGRNSKSILGKRRWVGFIFIILSAGLIVLGSVYSIRLPQV